MTDATFRAVWGTPLIAMTLFGTFILIVIPIAAIIGVPGIASWVRWIMGIVPLVTLLGSAAFMVRGYSLVGQSLRIKRLGWQTQFDLTRLISATADPEAAKRSMRIFGNGGLFAFVGGFRNSKLGVYRLFGTDISKAVILRFAQNTVVVTPDEPARFVVEINSRRSISL